MVKQINEYTTDELSAKINAIKAEREKTANALKKYEEELERRKKFPLGAPIGGDISRSYLLCFPSIESADKFDNEYFTHFIVALQDIADGKQIDIKPLLPLLKKGWVAYERYYGWVWFKNKPFILRGTEEDATWTNEGSYSIIGGFNIKPAENWETSLMECGL